MSPAPLAPFPDDWQRALAVVAHPDDLEYGAASAVARWTSRGGHVAYLLVTRGEAGIDSMTPKEAARVRAEEQVRSAAVVGVDGVEFLDGHRDGAIEYGLRLRRDIAVAIRRHRPELLLTLNRHLTWSGGALNMADHRHVGLAALDAARDAANRWVFTEAIAQRIEPWAGVRYVAFAASPEATHYVDVSDTFDRGVASLREHRAYLEGLGEAGRDPDRFLRGMAQQAGTQVGVDLAVTFEIVPL